MKSIQPANRFKFTEASIASYAKKVPADQAEHSAWDTETKGLSIRYQFGGTGTYIIRYTVGQIKRKLKLGKVGAITLDEARKKARKALGQVEDKIDPVNERAKAATSAGQTFGKTAADFLKERAPDWSEEYRKANALYLNECFKRLHSLSLASVEQASAASALRTIKSERGPYAANRARAAGSAFYNWAWREGLCKHNPFEKTNKNKETKGQRFLSRQELKAVWLGAGESEFGDIVKLLILTMQRRDEIGGLPVAEFNRSERLLEIKGERFKNGKDNTIPLGEEAFKIVDKHYDTGRKFLFGAIDTGYSGWSKSKAQLDERLKTINAPWVLHDLRRTGKTFMSDELDVPLEISEAILNHTKKDLEAVYNGAKYIRRKREALDKYNDWLMEVVA